jgi:transposase
LLTPKGRLKLATSTVDDGWSIRRAAERFQVSPTTAKKWADRYRTGGPAAMADRHLLSSVADFNNVTVHAWASRRSISTACTDYLPTY